IRTSSHQPRSHSVSFTQSKKGERSKIEEHQGKKNMRGGSVDSPTMVTVPASTSLNILTGDDSMSDDVFDADEDSLSYSLSLPSQPQQFVAAVSARLQAVNNATPSSATGYRDYIPPAEVLQSDFTKARQLDNAWSKYKGDEDDPENCVHKTILLGDSGVGKTSILVQFDAKKFQHNNFAATVGIGFTNKMITIDDSQVKLQIWDTAGQERFRSVTHAYYRDAHALLLLYDVTNKQSFDNIRNWLGEIREYAQDDVVIMLLGNKSDCTSERVIRRDDGQRLANEYKVPFMETSAKTGLNVELAFHAVARELKARVKYEHGIHSDESRFNVHDYLKENQEQRSSCFIPSCSTT
ncbi:hypothetical protein QAD02_015792, partial [Eretmocerus hayati]